ncbi:hypothetical protein QSU92_11990 [Microbacterium sp. ET2]|uniref:hypothetical protein n=1 Tax=Microbacterium albipurpureum TaxID=3050384 RepID=UPI00259C9594|nr:hypothetical protein [Microbacterium sp. ET2 (Ac-2212)]WJL94686.1 hypothetical protein QSU92_11990 [Microbacterium sp. ET2 (Ac-2212)]
MPLVRRSVAAVGTITLALVLAGCSLDTVVWGPEGAAVIRQADRVIAAGASEDAAAVACDDSGADFGESADWRGLEPGEPERFDPGSWRSDPVPLDAEWIINLELDGSRVSEGLRFPGDVLFGEHDGELCVIDVLWSTIDSVG